MYHYRQKWILNHKPRKSFDMNVIYNLLALVLTFVGCLSLSGQTLSIVKSAAEGEIISFQGVSEVKYMVQGSSDLKTWNDLAVVSPQLSGICIYTNPPSTQPSMFFRVISEIPFTTVTIDPSSPEERTVLISTKVETPDVPIAVLRVKSTVDSYLRSIRLHLRPNGISSAFWLFNDVKIRSGGINYYGITDQNGDVEIYNLNIALLQDTPVSLSVLADVNEAGFFGMTDIESVPSVEVECSASGSFDGKSNNPEVFTASGHILAVQSADLKGEMVSFSSGMAIKAVSTSQTPVMDDGVWVSFTFDVSAGDSDLYIGSKSDEVNMTISGGIFTPDIDLISSVSAMDSPSCKVIRAGMTRQFTVSGLIERPSAGGTVSVSMTGVGYGFTCSENHLRNMKLESGQNVSVTF